MNRILVFLLSLGLVLSSTIGASAFPRIKDLVDVEGVRGNDLIGYGLVVGLNGTGDGLRNAPYTEESLVSFLENLGVNVRGEDLRPANVAAVIVTAVLPPFPRAGSKIDVSVSAVGDASSLLGGTLIMTPLNAADGQIYAVAQGAILAGGVGAEGEAATVQIGVPTSGSIPNGATIEREISFDFDAMQVIRLALRDPDFTTARRIEAVINGALQNTIARMDDAGTVTLDLSRLDMSPARLMSEIENLPVEPDQPARVIIDQRSGTIVLGADVKISRVAISQGNLTIRINEEPIAVQPNPFAEGETIVLPRTDIVIDEGGANGLALVEQNVTLADLVDGLNALGVGPRDMIDILKAIHAAGALHAELIII